MIRQSYAKESKPTSYFIKMYRRKIRGKLMKNNEEELEKLPQ